MIISMVRKEMARVIGTRLNDLDPYLWLNDVLEQIVSGQAKANDLDRLLAWNRKADRASLRVAAA